MKKKLILPLLCMLSLASPALAGVGVQEDPEAKLKFSALVRVDTVVQKTDTVLNGILSTVDSKGLDLNRAYLTAKYTIDSDWMLRVTTDMKYESVLTGKKSNIFLKYAYLQGKLLGDAAILRFGLSHTPWVDYELALWKYDYLIDEPSSTFGYEASSDLGIGLKGKLADGMVRYWVTGINGKGYTNIKKTNGMDFSGRIGVYPLKGLTLDVGYRTGYKGTKVGSAAPLGKQKLTRAMITYGAKSYRVGFDYMINKDETIAVGTKDTLYSVWGRVNLGGGFGLVARYDHEKSNKINATALDADQITKQIVAGVNYTPAKKVNFIFAYKRKKFDDYKYILNDSMTNTIVGVWSQFAY